MTHGYFLLKKTTRSVTKITKMFHERALFYHDYAALEQVQITHYLSMLNTGITEFVENN